MFDAAIKSVKNFIFNSFDSINKSSGTWQGRNIRTLADSAIAKPLALLVLAAAGLGVCLFVLKNRIYKRSSNSNISHKVNTQGKGESSVYVQGFDAVKKLLKEHQTDYVRYFDGATEAGKNVKSTAGARINIENIQNFLERGGEIQIVKKADACDLGLDPKKVSTLSKQGITVSDCAQFSKSEKFITACQHGQVRSQITAVLLEDNECKVIGVIRANSPINPDANGWVVDPESSDNNQASNSDKKGEFEKAFDKTRKKTIDAEWAKNELKVAWDEKAERDLKVEKEDREISLAINDTVGDEVGQAVFNTYRQDCAEYFQALKPCHFVCFAFSPGIVLHHLLQRNKDDLKGFKITILPYEDTVTRNQTTHLGYYKILKGICEFAD